MRKGRYLTAILAARLLIVFLAVSGMLSGHTISHTVPGQSDEAAKHKLDGSQDPAFAETRRLYRLPVLLYAPGEAECRYQLKC